MAELENIISAVCSTLQEQETAIHVFPAGAKKHHSEPVVTVGLKAGEGVPSGFSEYIGERYDTVNDAYYEVYGKRLELTLGINVFSPKSEEYGSGECLDIVSRIIAAVPLLPSGIKVRKISCGETKFDTSVNMFLCTAELECTCFLYAERTGEDEFLDFTLRGVLV